MPPRYPQQPEPGDSAQPEAAASSRTEPEEPAAPEREAAPAPEPRRKRDWGSIFQKTFDKINKSFTAAEDEEI